ncbi:MAG: hypothetical protein K2F56_03940, partial [Anaeroplasmataceae bacterium]|nr:hypothetical protein [Anaeroplasmataceae bacterium]
MRSIRLANLKDTEFLVENDKHIAYNILRESIEKGYIYVLEQDDKIIGWLRSNLFWDNPPFLNMLYII